MHFPLTDTLIAEAKRFALRSACCHCFYYVPDQHRCAHEWPDEGQGRWPLDATAAATTTATADATTAAATAAAEPNAAPTIDANATDADAPEAHRLPETAAFCKEFELR